MKRRNFFTLSVGWFYKPVTPSLEPQPRPRPTTIPPTPNLKAFLNGVGARIARWQPERERWNKPTLSDLGD